MMEEEAAGKGSEKRRSMSWGLPELLLHFDDKAQGVSPLEKVCK